MRVAAAAKAELIVIGSSHGEFTGRLRPGSTAWRLLQGAPCAVALAPQGHRLRPQYRFNRVTAAFDGSPGGYAALSTAARIADAMEQRLRVVRVFETDAAAPPWLPDAPGFLRLAQDAERAARSALERAVTGHPGAEVAFLAGDPARELARESEISDLLVIGSRSYGPDGVVVLGGVERRRPAHGRLPGADRPDRCRDAAQRNLPRLRETTDRLGGRTRISRQRLPVAS